MAIMDASLDQVTDLIARGIKDDLSKSIEKKFHEIIDPMIKELAVEYAKNVTAKVHSMKMPMTGGIHMQVRFNDENIAEFKG